MKNSLHMLLLVCTFSIGLSYGPLLSGSQIFIDGSSYSMTCTFPENSVNVYITINGIRFTEEHGGIRSDKSTLIVTIPDIGMDYDAAVFVCYAGGEESNSITIHAALGRLPAPNLSPSPKPFPTPTMTNSYYSNFSTRLSSTVSTNTSTVSYTQPIITEEERAVKDNNVIIIAVAGVVGGTILLALLFLLYVILRYKINKPVTPALTTQPMELITTQPHIASNPSGDSKAVDDVVHTDNSEADQNIRRNDYDQIKDSASNGTSIMVGSETYKNLNLDEEGGNSQFVYPESSTSRAQVSEESSDGVNTVPAEDERGGRTGSIVRPSNAKPRGTDLPKSTCGRTGEMTFEKPSDVTLAPTASSTPSADSVGCQIQHAENGYGYFTSSYGGDGESTC